MRRLFFPANALVVLVSLAGCSTMEPPPRPQSQTAPGVNLAAYSTFGWASAAGIETSDGPTRMLDQNIRTAIHAELTQRGYTESGDHPQLLITYDTEAQEKIRSNPFQIGIGVGSWGSNMGGSVNVGSPSVQSYREGRLVIHVLDAAAVARGVALTLQEFPARTATPPPP